MRAAVSRGLGDLAFELEDVEIAPAAPHEVLISVRASGLCASDQHVLQHDFGVEFPMVLGHEICGLVVAIGAEVSRVSLGDVVIACLVRYCGTCDRCSRGEPSRCIDPDVVSRAGGGGRLSIGGLPVGQFVNIGGFAEQALVHENQVYLVPDGVPAASASIVGCAVVTGAGTVWNAARVQAGEDVAIVGCGGVGLHAIQAARIAGANRIVAIDLDDAKLGAALTAGATEAIRYVDDDSTLLQLRTGVDKAMEFVGNPGTALTAIRLTRREGAAFLVGLHRPGVTFTLDLHRELFSERRSVTAVEMGSGDPRETIPRIFDHYLGGDFQLDSLVGAQVGLEHIGEGYRLVAQGQVGRVVAIP